MSFIKTIVPIICAFFLVASPTLADGEKAPEDKTTKRNINKQIQFWDDFIQGLKRDRDSQGNVTYGQCMARAEKKELNANKVHKMASESENCYEEEDRARQWCGDAWDRIRLP
ncbi:hypothetical protein QT397_02375 (plasmid) [Microbulbifer sp. MKSA007]|nr:hypothetical protein QT397_02375 [Microbulbifer sp. MKSA007]